MIIPKNQFTLSQAFKSSAIKSQYSNKTMAIIAPTAIKCFRFIAVIRYKEQNFKKNVLIRKKSKIYFGD